MWPAGTNPHVFGHNAAGGTVGWADPDARLGVMITHNRMFPHGPREDNALFPIGEAVRKALGVPG
jgi:CubicO group peptidase (beta-lactamase class C family)